MIITKEILQTREDLFQKIVCEEISEQDAITAYIKAGGTYAEARAFYVGVLGDIAEAESGSM